MKEDSAVKRRFAVGEEWLYLKIYLRSFFADKILLKIQEFISSKIADGKVEKWFFIRYYDPGFHVRVRLFLPDPSETAGILSEINAVLENEIKKGIATILLDTYIRELERYDPKCIEQVEELFFYDTITVLPLLNGVEQNLLSENDRWIYGLLALDKTLSDFGMDLNEKLVFVSNINSHFSVEFKKDKVLNKQLDKAFREYEELITDSLKNDNAFSQLLAHRSEISRKAVSKIIMMDREKMLTQNFHGILSSCIHMNCNRLFRIEQRKQEYILYDFLTRFYTKELYKNKKLSINVMSN
ncbi:thiopeptide-type bacteriocin biosynthesis protein [Chryseobacterium defluvii]|uniref:Thiopeptide-type bacteriocin biosynthesis protein n=1 Tax=Chryseobacterium defluvii TaxID=160396 RepID=A0A840KH76_9FLAO|nr:thiopeptide-type bacteriocin biosynthesis protein [Chryseobacterium defluvii]MBB4807368.1 thiopeptide-type bacteriocin biosynthesis protein [Chryseobacterium defluvii]